MADPTDELVERVARRLERPVERRLCDEATLDGLLQTAYGASDAEEVTRALREDAPELSAYRRALSGAQIAIACMIGFLLVLGVLVDVGFTARVLVTMATAFFVSNTGFRLYAAWKGSRPGATIDPSPAQLMALDERELPLYTVLLPLYKEKPATVRALFDALSRMDYPKHKLDALLLIEADDAHTRGAVEQVGLPPWMRVLRLPPGTPRTKPRAMGIGLRYAKGALVTVYDAEDKPDPAQLKKAVWGFQRAEASVACLQAKLGYYNPRQNLLTRWFTLEYDGWFNIFLPGLHRIGAPIPLGGTSNHFRREALEECLGWDPYNVTEDADLGLRFARLGRTTTMLESTTGEEANSQVPIGCASGPAGAKATCRPCSSIRAARGGCCASSAPRPRPFSCSRSAAHSSPRCWPRCSGSCSRSGLSFSPSGLRRSSQDRSTTPPRSAWWPATSRSCSSASARR